VRIRGRPRFLILFIRSNNRPRDTNRWSRLFGAPLISNPRNQVRCRLRPPRHDQMVRDHRDRKPALFAKVFVLLFFYGSGGAKFPEIVKKRGIQPPSAYQTVDGTSAKSAESYAIESSPEPNGSIAPALRCHPSPNNGIGRRVPRLRDLRPNGSIALFRMCAIASSTESVA
jgi:hypothetical protein